MRAALITPEGRSIQPTVDMPDADQLAWFQHNVGGWIEHVGLPQTWPGVDPGVSVGMYINEEGKLDELPPNVVATRLMLGLGGREAFPPQIADYIAGPAVLAATDMATGEETDLPDGVFAELRRLGFTVEEVPA